MVGSASGKVILLGEHAVVYGVPALVVGIDRGATASAVVTGHGPTSASELSLGQQLRVSANGTSDVARAFAALLDACEVGQAVQVNVATELPAAAGLGCSAALGVAIVRALDSSLGRATATPASTIARAMAWEEIFHGNPSGIDATAAARGGCLWYQKLDGRPTFQEVRLGGALTLAVGHTGTASSTRTMVEHIAKLRDRNPEAVAQAFEAVSTLVHRARGALEEHDMRTLGRAMNDNQVLLATLALSTPEIDEMCRLAREARAFGAKLTGSGGGGCVIALTEGGAEPVLERWASAGFRGFSTRVVPHGSASFERREAT
jgi:mevalonate kinase